LSSEIPAWIGRTKAFHLVRTIDRGSDYASKNEPLGYGVESFVGQVGEHIGVARR
jgi:hypothetical protein